MYDRIVKFGVPVVSKPFAQQAWIEYFKIYEDLHKAVEKEVKGVVEDNWVQILTIVMNKLKYDPMTG